MLPEIIFLPNYYIFSFLFLLLLFFATTCLQTCCLLVFWLAMNSSLMLNKWGERDILALFLILVGKFLISHHRYDVNYKSFIDHLYQVRKFPSSFFLVSESFYHDCVLGFIKLFFYIYLCIWSCDFSSLAWHGLHWFLNVEPTLHTWDKFHLFLICNSFYTLLDLTC